MAGLKNIMIGGGKTGVGGEIMPLAAEIPLSVLDRMLQAEADVVEPAVRENARRDLEGKYATGKTAESLRRKNPENRKSDGERMLALTFEGTRKDKHHTKGERSAAIAFLNEYGAKGRAARPFIRTAMEKNEPKAVEAALKILDDWLKEQ